MNLEAAAAARLAIEENAYVLSLRREGAWVPLATLPGGAAALLAPRRPVDEAGLERAIEVAENWLMPHARALAGLELQVADAMGRLAAGLQAVLAVSAPEWSVEQFEELFLRLLDVATGRIPQLPAGREAFAADVLLLRELAHHGRVGTLRLLADAGPSASR